jgi:hypothetical protein
MSSIDPGFAQPLQVQGDVQSLPLGSQVVTAIQGRPVTTDNPGLGQFYEWTGTQWGLSHAPVATGQIAVWNGSQWAQSTAPTTAGQLLEWSGSAWTPAFGPGTEIGYDAITSPVAITGSAASAATTCITAAAHTFDGSPVMMEIYCPLLTTPSAASGNLAAIGLAEGSTVSTFTELVTTAAVSLKVPVIFKVRFTPSLGSHTYKVVAWASNTTGSPTFEAGAGSGTALPPAYIRFTKV